MADSTALARADGARAAVRAPGIRSWPEEGQQRIELNGGPLVLMSARSSSAAARPPRGLPSSNGAAYRAAEYPSSLRPVESGTSAREAPRHPPRRKMGRAEQRDDGLSGEIRHHELEHEIQRGGVGLGGKRERIERLIWNAGIGKDVTRQVHIRQRALEHDRPPIRSAPPPVFTAAAMEDSSSSRSRFTETARLGRHNRGRGGWSRDLVWIGRKFRFLEARHELFEAIEQACGDGRASRHDVDLFEMREARQQRSRQAKGPMDRPSVRQP